MARITLSTLEAALSKSGMTMYRTPSGTINVRNPDGEVFHRIRIKDRRKRLNECVLSSLKRKCNDNGYEFSLELEAPVVSRKDAVRTPAREERDLSGFEKISNLADEWSIPEGILSEMLHSDLTDKALEGDLVDESAFLKWAEENEPTNVVKYLQKYRYTEEEVDDLLTESQFDVWYDTRKKIAYARTSDIEAAAVRNSGVVVFDESDMAKVESDMPKHIRPLGNQKYEIRNVDWRLAWEILLSTNRNNRKPSKKRAAYLIRQFRSGYGLPGYVCFAELPDGRLILKNGQHFLSTVYNLRLESHPALFLTVKVQDTKHALELFGQFDSPRSVRSETEQILAVYDEYEPPCQRKNAARFAKALFAYHERTDPTTGAYNGHCGETGYPDQKAIFMRAEAGARGITAFLEKIFGRTTERALRKQAVLVAAIGHYYLDPADADEFWAPITGAGGGFDEYEGGAAIDVRALLRTYLLSARINQHNRGYVTPERDIYAMTNKAWNIFRDDRAVQKLYMPSSPVVPH